MALCFLFGHKWYGCTCAKCGKIRDQDHDWTLDCGMCAKCGTSREDGHVFATDHRKCDVCGQASSWKRAVQPDAVIRQAADDLWQWDWEAKNKELSIRGAGDIQDFTAGCAARGYNTAVEFFTELTSRYPKNGLLLWALGWALEARRNRAEALQHFREAAELGCSLAKQLPDDSIRVRNGFGDVTTFKSNGEIEFG